MLPRIFEIEKRKVENDYHITLFFKGKIDYHPGQFIMLWLPGIDEKPFALSYHDEERFAVTIEAKGKFSKKVMSMEKEEKLGIRGPYGHGFSLSGRKICVVSGGTGMASVAVLIERLKDLGKKITIIYGARNKELLLYPGRFNEIDYCTDDGSQGYNGFTTELFDQKAKYQKFDMVYTCGPEIMMKSILEICQERNIMLEASLERYMRCGFGVCGACVCGKERVCVEGPVFNSEKLKKMDDFGKYAQLKSGKDVDLKEYYSWRTK